ncbi:hypothetical protein D3C71_1618210 [compost metagenome]
MLHFNVPGGRCPHLFCRHFLKASILPWKNLVLRSLPNPANAARKAIAVHDTVGGPPTVTPLGMATFSAVGNDIERNGFFGFFIRNGLIIPARLQSSTGIASRENGSPSEDTVRLPMKISSPSNCGPIGTANGGPHTPNGIWTLRPPVPAVARCVPLTLVVEPINGM